MTQFLSLPSGLIVNLALVTRIVPTSAHGEPAFIVHFSTGDLVTLSPEDAAALRVRLRILSPTTPTWVRTALFWLVIVVAVVLVWFAVRGSR